MTLPTFSELPIISPLAAIVSSHSPDQQAQATRQKVGLGEITDRALLHLRGDTVGEALQQPAMKIGDVVATEDGLLIRLRRDEIVVVTRDARTALARLADAPYQRLATLTDLTHGRCGLLLVGARASDVLPKICALDFSNPKFPHLHAAQTILAKVRTLIIRLDIDSTPAYGLFVDRSLAAYVWDVVFDAMREFDGVALGKDGIESLRMGSLW